MNASFVPARNGEHSPTGRGGSHPAKLRGAQGWLLHSPFLHLLWKEYRQLRGLWCAILLLAVSLTASAAAAEPGGTVAYSAALTFSALFALGAGAITYAGERESGSLALLQNLPARSAAVLVAKTIVALTGTALLAAILLPCAAAALWAINLLFEPASPHAMSTPVAVLAVAWLPLAVEFFVWTLLFSLTSRSVLIAALSGGLCTALSVYAFSMLLGGSHMSPLFTAEKVAGSLWARAILTALVALVAGRVALRGFRDDEMATGPAIRRRDTGMATALTNFAGRLAATIGRLAAPLLPGEHGWDTVRRRLLWQHVAQSRTIYLTAFAMLIPLVLLTITVWLAGNALELAKAYLPFCLGLTLLAPSVLGAGAFLPDNLGQSRRFLAERGYRARDVWWSRQLPNLAASLVCSAISWALLGLVVLAVGEQLVTLSLPVLATLAVVGFVAGQFAGMFVAQGMLALVTGVILSGMLMAITWLSIGTGDSVAWQFLPWYLTWVGWLPPAAAMWLQTWLRAGQWLELRRTTVVRRVLTSPFLWALVLVPTFVCCYRAWEYPAVAEANWLLKRDSASRSHTGIVPVEAFSEMAATHWYKAERTYMDYRALSQELVDLGGIARQMEEQAQIEAPERPSPNDPPEEYARKQEAVEAYEAELNRRWLEANQQNVARLVELAARPDYVDIHPTLWRAGYGTVSVGGQTLEIPRPSRRKDRRQSRLLQPWPLLSAPSFQRLLCEDAQRLTAEDRLDEAWERIEAAQVTLHRARQSYPYSVSPFVYGARLRAMLHEAVAAWLAAPGQTPERIREAIGRWRLPQPRNRHTVLWRVYVSQCVWQDPARAAIVFDLPTLEPPVYFWLSVIGEQERQRRAVGIVARRDFRVAEYLDSLARGSAVVPPEDFSFASDYFERQKYVWMPPYGYLWYQAPETRLGRDESSLAEYAALIEMALVAYRLENDRWPQNLDALRGDYLMEVPHDPFSGRPFRYYPNGLPPLPDGYRPHPTEGISTDRMAEMGPCLASGRPSVLTVHSRTGHNRIRLVLDETGRWVERNESAMSLQSPFVLSDGTYFCLPELAATEGTDGTSSP